MKTYDKGLLEPLLGSFRYKKVIKHIDKNKPLTVVDLGCGDDIGFYKHAIKKGVNIKQYIGVDPLISSETILRHKKGDFVKFILKTVDKTIPLDTGTVDYVIGLAFLEHLDNPQDVIKESIRILKPGGVCIFTAPTPKAKAVLEFLSYKLRLISKTLTEEHKTYFNKEKILESLSPYEQKINIVHEYFQFGFNNLILIKKIS
ncbi:MAG: methyltransferase domain-containing protein [Candidatus Daviesbacteria bacterium]|nr:methyltransferase domain-containing protein [Candidatus Daviesbacteria bacterium]